MADFNLSVALTASANDFRNEMNRAAVGVKMWRESVERQSRAAQTNTRNLYRQTTDDVKRASKEHRDTLEGMGRASALVGVAIAGGMALAVKRSMEFGQQMSILRGVAGANEQEFGQLRDTVLAAGEATVFSATEASKGAQELARVDDALRLTL